MGQCASCCNCICDRELKNATKGKDFTFKGQCFKAKVVSVYDGDTITVVFRHGGVLEQHKIRLIGIDTPELKPKMTVPNRDQVIADAKKAKSALEGKVLNKVIKVECGEFDKYGRILGTLKVKESWWPWKSRLNVNEWLIQERLGVSYDGGTK